MGWRWILALVLMLVAVVPARAQRVALVIGNGAYRAVPALPNPARDARAMADALRRIGFDVDLVVDADRAAMERAVRRLGERAAGAEAAMLFYAGHAVEVGGHNYLVPITARIASARDLPFETLDFDAIMAQLEGRSRVNLVFLDACRDNPFRLVLGEGDRGIASAGLASVRSPVGTLVAFATAPGQVAADGTGQDSPFTVGLLQFIATPGVEVREMLGRVRQYVRQSTGGRQVPWTEESLEGAFYFAPAGFAGVAPPPYGRPGAVPAPAPQPPTSAEGVLWDTIAAGGSAAEFSAYLRRFPNGAHAVEAQQRLAALSAPAQPMPGYGSSALQRLLPGPGAGGAAPPAPSGPVRPAGPVLGGIAAARPCDVNPLSASIAGIASTHIELYGGAPCRIALNHLSAISGLETESSPGHGRLAFEVTPDGHASATTYTPNPGYAGRDNFAVRIKPSGNLVVVAVRVAPQ